MYLICDSNDIIQDIATEKKNLSRGYRFAGYRLYENVDVKNALIGDTYKDGVLTPDPDTRQTLAERAANRSKVDAEIRRVAIEALKQRGELPPDYTEL